MYLIFEGPSESPQDINITVYNSTSLNVTWNPPTILHQNGIITKYKLIYSTTSSEVSNTATREVDGSRHSVLLVGLEKNTEYNITMSAGTSAGYGPYSNAVLAVTDEDGNIVKNTISF